MFCLASADTAHAVSAENRLASCLSSCRNFCAELHRSMRYLFAACAESNSCDDCGENDCALHCEFSFADPSCRAVRLASHLRSGRHVGAELHRLMRHFPTARSKRYGRHDCRNNYQPLHTLHGQSPNTRSALANSLGTGPAQDVQELWGPNHCFPTQEMRKYHETCPSGLGVDRYPSAALNQLPSKIKFRRFNCRPGASGQCWEQSLLSAFN